jgi:hypothetical protein
MKSGSSGLGQNTDYLVLYPGTSIELNIFAEKPGLNYITTQTPL